MCSTTKKIPEQILQKNYMEWKKTMDASLTKFKCWPLEGPPFLCVEWKVVFVLRKDNHISFFDL